MHHKAKALSFVIEPTPAALGRTSSARRIGWLDCGTVKVVTTSSLSLVVITQQFTGRLVEVLTHLGVPYRETEMGYQVTGGAPDLYQPVELVPS